MSHSCVWFCSVAWAWFTIQYTRKGKTVDLGIAAHAVSPFPGISSCNYKDSTPYCRCYMYSHHFQWLLLLLIQCLQLGKNLQPAEVLLGYTLGIWFLCLHGDWGSNIQQMARQNAICQLVLFGVVVQIPTLLTGHMSYVDIGWPSGLCVLAYTTFTYSEGGSDLRTFLVCGALLLHGLRMAVGALVVFFPYRWKKVRMQWVSSSNGWMFGCCRQMYALFLIIIYVNWSCMYYLYLVTYISRGVYMNPYLCTSPRMPVLSFL